MNTELVQKAAATPPPKKTAMTIPQLREKLAAKVAAMFGGKQITTTGSTVEQIQQLVEAMPSEPKQAATVAPSLPAVANFAAFAKPSATAASPKITLPALRAVHALCFGEGQTRQIESNASNYSHGHAQMAEATKLCEFSRNRYGENSPAAEAASIERAKLSIRLKAERAGSDADQFKRMASSFLENGISVPGLDFRGLGLSVSVNGSTNTLSPKRLEHANASVAEFLAAIGGDLSALQAQTQPARAARQFLASTQPHSKFTGTIQI